MYMILLKDPYNDRKFIKFLIKRMQNKMLATIDLDKLKPWDEYLSQSL